MRSQYLVLMAAAAITVHAPAATAVEDRGLPDVSGRARSERVARPSSSADR
jgi:hypothetical protein